MAEAPEQDLSPEEKLLRVIQSGGDAGGDEAGSQAAAPPNAVAAPPPRQALKPVAAPSPARAAKPAAGKLPQSAPEEESRPEAPSSSGSASPPVPPSPQSRLKLVQPRRQSREPGETPPAAPAPAAAAPAAAAVGKRASVRPGGAIRTINRALAVVIVVILSLCALEIWSGAKAGGVAPATPQAPEFPGGGSEFDLPALAMLQDAFRQKQIWDFGMPEAEPDSQGIVEPPLPPQPEIEKTLKLIGLSAPPGARREQIEAVILDVRDGMMHVVKMGEKLAFNGREFEVQNVAADEVLLTDGEQSARIR